VVGQVLGDITRDPQEIDAAFGHLAEYFGRLIATKRARPDLVLHHLESVCCTVG
jgi:hypothetical protein